MKINDKDEIIKRMISGSEAVRKNKNLKVYRRRRYEGKASRRYKIKLGKHMNKGIKNKDNDIGDNNVS